MLIVPKQGITSPVYDVGFTLDAGVRCYMLCGDAPYICLNVRSGSVFPDAPVSIFRRSVYPCLCRRGGLTFRVVNASSLGGFTWMLCMHFALIVME